MSGSVEVLFAVLDKIESTAIFQNELIFIIEIIIFFLQRDPFLSDYCVATDVDKAKDFTLSSLDSNLL